jgi:hypothetical protein
MHHWMQHEVNTTISDLTSIQVVNCPANPIGVFTMLRIERGFFFGASLEFLAIEPTI